jgi:hypothetical protein
VKLRFEVLFKEFHPRINLTTFFFTITYLLEGRSLGTGPWDLNSKTSKNLSVVATLMSLNFKILSMQDTYAIVRGELATSKIKFDMKVFVFKLC